ncbi:MAG: tetratricopeptide repeat protein [Deltaproteobacteria bacterium]|jgi:tetratricopeptide (TPR) repeat protein|nr:tetratricopeptide repeat protein [Deltaproteobacteria bacterium]
MPNKNRIFKAACHFLKPFICRWYELKTYNRFSLPVSIGLLGIILLCVSCAASSIEPPSPKKVLTGYDQPAQEREVEANDMACSYFYFLWGKTAENNGRFEEALEAYEKALLCDEESQFLKQNLAILLIKMDRKEQAATLLEQIIGSNPQDTDNRVLLAKVYRSMGLMDEAAAIYQGLLEINEDHDTLLMLGTLYAQNKEYDKAQKILNRLIQLEGDSYMAHYSLARLYRELQYYEKAAASYEKALELNWFERLAYEVAEFYEERREFDKAIEVYNRIIEEGQLSDVAKTKLVNLYLTLGENDKALKLLRDLRSIMPESHNIDITISRILLSQEKYDEAIMILEDVLETNPELTVVRYLIGMAYYRDNNSQKAEKHLKIIPPESNLYEDTIFLRLKILSEDDNQAEAIDLLQQQISDPGTRKPSFYILLASLYRENKEVERARETYELAGGLYPDDIDLLYNYGIFLEKIGEQENAMTKMQAVLAKDPDNGAALNYVGYTWADNNVHLEKALEYIRKAVELMPDDGYVRDSLGWVLYKMGDIEQAIIELERASELVADDPIIKEHLGDVYLQAGQFEKALAAYKQAYELYEEENMRESVNKKIDSVKTRSQK